jgi:hypothetical protein
METEPALCPAIILSDSVIREHGTGKISLIGSFTTYNFPTFPFVAGPFIVTVLVTNLKGKLDRFPITVRIEGATTGHVLASSVAELTTEKEVPRSEVFEIPVAIPPINYPEAGVYKVVILAQNEPLGSRDLTVRSLAAI